jgi:hypothetical protein
MTQGARMQQAPDGALVRLLKNDNLKTGMRGWLPSPNAAANYHVREKYGRHDRGTGYLARRSAGRGMAAGILQVENG